jgi:regulator of replication initiation timing
MAKEIKIDKHIIDDVTKLRNEVNKIMFDFGNFKLERINLEQRISDIEKMESDMAAKYKGNITREQRIAEKLKEKHGEGIVNLEKGVFIPSEKESK